MLKKRFRIQNKLFHLIGIGGIGMSAIAILLKNWGAQVQGSDKKYNSHCQRLKMQDIEIFVGHKKDNINKADYVVTSSAIDDTNPEVQEALKQNICILHRFDILQLLCRHNYTIGVCGASGKTTISAMIFSMLNNLNYQVTTVIGGILPSIKSNIQYHDNSDYCVVELDESDGKFVDINTDIGVIPNIDSDHLDFYKNLDNIIDHFKHFICSIPFYGSTVFCLDDNIISTLMGRDFQKKSAISYSIKNPVANVFADNIHYGTSTIFDLHINYKNAHYKIDQIKLPVIGECNLSNALAAISVGVLLEFNKGMLSNCLNNFTPVRRRLSLVGHFSKAAIIDDYAHHPAKIAAALDNVQILLNSKGNQGCIIVVCEIHKYSRVAYLSKEYIDALEKADIIFFTPVFSAGEKLDKKNDHTKLMLLLHKKKKLTYYVESVHVLKSKLEVLVNPEDVILCVGAGEITQWAMDLAN